MRCELRLLICLSLPFLLQADDRFWQKQDPATWTAAQIAQFESDSPWAKQVTAILTSNDSNMAETTPRTTGRRGAVYSSRGSGSAKPTDLPKFNAIVRWVNAPMKRLLKLSLPDSFQGHYIISVTGLPVGENPDSLIEQTSLQLKRNDPVHPDLAYQDPNDKDTIYFAFVPSTVPVGNARLAEFKMDAAPFEVKTKFLLIEMKWRGEPSY